MEWYFDTIDRRAGRGFVSLRGAELEEALTLDEAAATYFIGPPDFSPELTTNRAMAMSAGRGSFGVGLLDEAGEIPFPSLEAAADFVRRGYLRGAGGDGFGPGGEPSPPPRPPFEPEGGGPTISSRHWDDPAKVFADNLKSFLKIAAGSGAGALPRANGQAELIFRCQPTSQSNRPRISSSRSADGGAGTTATPEFDDRSR